MLQKRLLCYASKGGYTNTTAEEVKNFITDFKKLKLCLQYMTQYGQTCLSLDKWTTPALVEPVEDRWGHRTSIFISGKSNTVGLCQTNHWKTNKFINMNIMIMKS